MVSLSCTAFAQPFYPACAQLLDAAARIVITSTALKGQFSSDVPSFAGDLRFLAAVSQKQWFRLAELADRYKWHVRQKLPRFPALTRWPGVKFHPRCSDRFDRCADGAVAMFCPVDHSP